MDKSNLRQAKEEADKKAKEEADKKAKEAAFVPKSLTRDQINQTIAAAASALNEGDFETAKAHAQDLLKRDFNDPLGYHLLGRIASAEGDARSQAPRRVDPSLPGPFERRERTGGSGLRRSPALEDHAPRLVDRVALSQQIGLSVPTIDRRRKDGSIPSITVGGRVLFDPSAVIAALASTEAPQTNE